MGTPAALANREAQKQRPNIILKAVHTKRAFFKLNILVTVALFSYHILSSTSQEYSETFLNLSRLKDKTVPFVGFLMNKVLEHLM